MPNEYRQAIKKVTGSAMVLARVAGRLAYERGKLAGLRSQKFQRLVGVFSLTERQALALAYRLEGITYDAVGDRLKITAGRAQELDKHARRKLRALIDSSLAKEQKT